MSFRSKIVHFMFRWNWRLVHKWFPVWVRQRWILISYIRLQFLIDLLNITNDFYLIIFLKISAYFILFYLFLLHHLFLMGKRFHKYCQYQINGEFSSQNYDDKTINNSNQFLITIHHLKVSNLHILHWALLGTKSHK